MVAALHYGLVSLPAMSLLGMATSTLCALVVDRWLGEPTVRLHPVVWIGNYLGWAGKRVQGQSGHTEDAPAAGHAASNHKCFWLGALAWCAGAAMVVIAASLVQWGVVWAGFAFAFSLTGSEWDGAVGVLVSALLLGILLKPLLAWAMLRSEVLAVENALAPEQGGTLAAGRARLRWLVSRDVTQLTESQVRESAIETLAENFNDSVIAPIFWFVLLGLPGAALYRFANTADAMWGYRGTYQGQNWEWAGKWAARADDVLSWLPARLTALLLAMAAGGVSLATLRIEARRTASPNSGWPMAAMALALNVCLHKPGVYALNAGGRAPLAADTARAVRLASHALLAPVGLALGVIGLALCR